MNIIYVLAPLALLLGFGFAASFIMSVMTGQYDDTETPPHRILLEDELQNKNAIERLAKGKDL